MLFVNPNGTCDLAQLFIVYLKTGYHFFNETRSIVTSFTFPASNNSRICDCNTRYKRSIHNLIPPSLFPVWLKRHPYYFG